MSEARTFEEACELLAKKTFGVNNAHHRRLRKSKARTLKDDDELRELWNLARRAGLEHAAWLLMAEGRTRSGELVRSLLDEKPEGGSCPDCGGTGANQTPRAVSGGCVLCGGKGTR